ncbi:MAG: chromate transporter [Sphingobacterium sp.]
MGFGGPAAHSAMLQDEVVRKRKWLTDQHFLNFMDAIEAISSVTTSLPYYL